MPRALDTQLELPLVDAVDLADRAAAAISGWFVDWTTRRFAGSQRRAAQCERDGETGQVWTHFMIEWFASASRTSFCVNDRLTEVDMSYERFQPVYGASGWPNLETTSEQLLPPDALSSSKSRPVQNQRCIKTQCNA